MTRAGNIVQDDQYHSGFIAGVGHAIRCRALAWRQYPGYLSRRAP